MKSETNIERFAIKGVGFLFLLTMAVSIAGNLLIVQLTSGQDYLSAIGQNPFRLGLAGFFILVNALGVMGIGVLIFPTLNRVQPFAALAYLAARIFEAASLTIGIIAVLTLVALAKQFDTPPGDDTLVLYLHAKMAIQTNWYAYHSAMIALGFGSLPFCLLLYRHKLVPAILAALGLLGYTILGVTSVLSIIGFDLGLLVTIPVFFFEVILGLWLLIKGMNNRA